MITQAGQSSGRNHSLATQDRPYKVYADGVWYKVVLRHPRIMLPQIIQERERRRLTRKNGQRPLSLLPQGARGQTAGQRLSDRTRLIVANRLSLWSKTDGLLKNVPICAMDGVRTGQFVPPAFFLNVFPLCLCPFEYNRNQLRTI